jgi:hypothetical protein
MLLAYLQGGSSCRLGQALRGRCLFVIGEDQPVQHPDELDADDGLDQSRDARPSLVLIGILAKHERQIEASKPLNDAPASLGGLAAAQHSCGKCRSVDKIQGINRIRRTMNVGSCTLQKYPQTARDKGLFLKHKNRAADKCCAVHDIFLGARQRAFAYFTFDLMTVVSRYRIARPHLGYACGERVGVNRTCLGR